MFIKNILLSLFILVTVNNLSAQESVSVDSFLVGAGWTKQNDAWMDPKTGLIWGPELEKTSWGEAKAYCEKLEFGGRGDWRLPTLNELELSVCEDSGYPTRTACPRPRDHQKDLWLLNKDLKKGISYWASDDVPADPYNSYYFIFDKEGQYVMTSKGDKSMARCVAEGTALKEALAKKGNTEDKKEEKSEFSFYVAPFIGFGGFLNNEITVDNYPYLSAEFRLGMDVADNTMATLFINGGLNAKDFDYPMHVTITVGPEYFVTECFSVFAAVGFGILSNVTNILQTSSVNETNAGIAWKAGLSWQVLRWGDKDQFAIPLSLIYDGSSTKYVLCHTVVSAIGLMYFN